jgi:hypothetical protein
MARRYLLAIVVIAAVVALYVAIKRPEWGSAGFWKAHFAENADEILERSAGTYDTAAALALRRSRGAAATAADHSRAATIIHRNILAQEHRAERTPAGHPTEAALEESRIRAEMYGQAREHHRQALNGLTDGALHADEAARATRRFGQGRRARAGRAPRPAHGGAAPPTGVAPAAPEPEEPGGAQIIEAALHFAFAGLGTLLENDPVVAVHFAEVAGGDPAGIVLIPDVDLVGAAENRRTATLESRRAAAAEAAQGGGRGLQAAAFLDLSQRSTSDAQNSHDVSVNAAKKATVERLRREQPALANLETLEQIAEALRAGGGVYSKDPATGAPRPALTEKALKVVRRAANGERSAAAGATDEEVLRRVWRRGSAPANFANREALRQAFFDALVDCWEPAIGGERIQCVDGRIGRLVGSLVLLDADPLSSEVHRLEHHKNAVFVAVQERIRAAAEAAAVSANPAQRAVGRAWRATTKSEMDAEGALDPAAEAAFIEQTREAVVRTVEDYSERANRIVPNTIPGHVLEGLKREASAAVY